MSRSTNGLGSWWRVGMCGWWLAVERSRSNRSLAKQLKAGRAGDDCARSVGDGRGGGGAVAGVGGGGVRGGRGVAVVLGGGDPPLTRAPEYRGGEVDLAADGVQPALRCDECGIDYPEPEPQLFNFNRPLGACPACEGFGNIVATDMVARGARSGQVAPRRGDRAVELAGVCA